MKALYLSMIALLCCWGSAVQATVAGRWVGQAYLNQAAMPIELTVSDENGELTAQLYLPEMVFIVSPVVERTATGLSIELPFGLGRNDLTLAPAGEVLATSGGGLALTLRRVPAVRYQVRELRIATPRDELAATFYVPSGSRRHPAVLLAGGATAQSRTHPSVVSWCHHFVRRNLACLVTDRRPDGQVRPGQSDLERDADDLRAALAFLRQQGEVDPQLVGLAAFSRGAWPALRVAANDSALRFLLLSAPSALSPGPAEAVSVRARMEAEERLLAEIEAAQAYYALYFAAAYGDRPWAEIDRAARAAEAAPWGRFVDQPLEPGHLAFWGRNGRFSNADDFPRIQVPVLAVWGERDRIVPPAVHEPLLRQGLTAAQSLSTMVFPAADHPIETDSGRDALGVWRWPQRAPGLIPLIDRWLAERLPAWSSAGS